MYLFAGSVPKNLVRDVSAILVKKTSQTYCEIEDNRKLKQIKTAVMKT